MYLLIALRVYWERREFADTEGLPASRLWAGWRRTEGRRGCSVPTVLLVCWGGVAFSGGRPNAAADDEPVVAPITLLSGYCVTGVVFSGDRPNAAADDESVVPVTLLSGYFVIAVVVGGAITLVSGYFVIAVVVGGAITVLSGYFVIVVVVGGAITLLSGYCVIGVVGRLAAWLIWRNGSQQRTLKPVPKGSGAQLISAPSILT